MTVKIFKVLLWPEENDLIINKMTRRNKLNYPRTQTELEMETDENRKSCGHTSPPQHT